MNTSVDKLFLIAAGGTGMRCLESFIHLCAMGMFDGKEIEVLSLDTDQANGNKSRVSNLVNTYNKIKNDGNPNSNTFFSAKINFHEFFTDYNSEAGFGNFHQITKTPRVSGKNLDENQMLADLFMENSVQVFDLSHGYRAQTHLGSYLMYHAFIDTAHKVLKGDNTMEHEDALNNFCEKLRGATEGARVFIFGSLFGGTGASSLPILPKAIEDFITITGQGKTSLPDNVKFGSTLLTEYFKFNTPKENQKSEEQDAVIADSRFFTLNSQASLQYYQNDPTIKKRFKKMYHIGWPIDPIQFSDENEKLVKTGGPTQKNDCHIVELISAAAAFDFFQSENIDNDELRWFYKTFEVDNNKLEISFNDLVGDGENGKKFARHFCALVQLMHLVLTQYEGSIGNNGVQTIIKNTQTNFTDYDNLDSNYTNHLNEYFREYFGYAIENKVFEGKWLYQIYKSLQGGALIFNHNIFSNDLSELEDIDFGKMWSEKNESYNWHKSLLQKFGKIGPSKFLEHFKDLDEVQKEFKNQDLVMPSEKFLAQLFNTFNSLNKITNI